MRGQSDSSIKFKRSFRIFGGTLQKDFWLGQTDVLLGGNEEVMGEKGRGYLRLEAAKSLTTNTCPHINIFPVVPRKNWEEKYNNS